MLKKQYKFFIAIIVLFYSNYYTFKVQDVIELPSFPLCDLAGSSCQRRRTVTNIKKILTSWSCVFKMNKEDIKLRVTDDLRCDLCIFKTTNQLNTGPNPTEEDSEAGATGHDDSRTVCLLYENLLEKIAVKNRMHRGKIKTRIRWRGNLDSLKDFVTLVLRKNGTWIEHTKCTMSHTFKTGGLVSIYYPSPTTIQLQGKLSTEIAANINFLKETLKNIDEQLLKGTSGRKKS